MEQKIAPRTVVVRKASSSDHDNIISLLNNFYPGVPEHWQKVFAPRSWGVEDDFSGFVIVDQQKIVGFLGTIFSEHETSQGKIKICNLTTWYVEPNYRQHGMLLFLKVMKIPNVSWTNLTPAPQIYEWLTRVGFQTLVDKQLLMLPLPKLGGPKPDKEIKIATHFSELDLQSHLHSIHHMHKNLHCKQVLITQGNQQCYCLIVVTSYKKIPLAKIYYVSNPELFKNVIYYVRLKLCWKLRVCYLQIEGNILNEKKMHGVFLKNLYPPRLYKSQLAKEEVTILGSELFVLGI